MCSIGWQTTNKWKPNPPVEKPLLEIIPLVGAAQLHGVEIWEPHYGTLSDDHKAKVRAALRQHGLKVPMVSSYYNFTKSLDHAKDSVANGIRIIHQAAELGAPWCRLFTGNHRSADATEEQWARAVSCIQELCAVAADYRLGWLAETHDWNLMDTVDGCQRLLARVDRPNFHLNFQPSTFYPQHLEALHTLAPHIRHVHCTNNRQADGEWSLPDGRMDWRVILERLKDHRFTGYVSIEYMKDQADRVLAEEGPWLLDLIQQVAPSGAA